MAVGDWSDTTDFWTGTPPILISAINANTMFLNTYRLLKGAERFSEAHRFSITDPVVPYYYSVRITDDCPWDALTIIEKILTTGAFGSVRLTVTHVGAEIMRSITWDCPDYHAWTWMTVVSNYDITGWAAGNHLIEVDWTASGCTTLEIKCQHAQLVSTV